VFNRIIKWHFYVWQTVHYNSPLKRRHAGESWWVLILHRASACATLKKWHKHHLQVCNTVTIYIIQSNMLNSIFSRMIPTVYSSVTQVCSLGKNGNNSWSNRQFRSHLWLLHNVNVIYICHGKNMGLFTKSKRTKGEPRLEGYICSPAILRHCGQLVRSSPPP